MRAKIYNFIDKSMIAKKHILKQISIKNARLEALKNYREIMMRDLREEMKLGGKRTKDLRLLIHGLEVIPEDI